jgi:hypothetical protein
MVNTRHGYLSVRCDSPIVRGLRTISDSPIVSRVISPLFEQDCQKDEKWQQQKPVIARRVAINQEAKNSRKAVTEGTPAVAGTLAGVGTPAVEGTPAVAGTPAAEGLQQ